MTKKVDGSQAWEITSQDHRVQEASGVLSALSMTASFLMLAVQDQDPLFQTSLEEAVAVPGQLMRLIVLKCEK
jgi:hypothetical protein